MVAALAMQGMTHQRRTIAVLLAPTPTLLLYLASMIRRTLRWRLGALLALLWAAACDDPPGPVEPEPVECAPGGDYLVGPAQIVDGACSRIPELRQLKIVPVVGERAFHVVMGGVTLPGQGDAQCLVQLATTDTHLGGIPVRFSGSFTVSGERLELLLDQHMTGLPAGETCDARYRLVGQRFDPATVGNPLGGACGTGATCVSALCAYGQVSACQFDTCVYQRDARGEELVYCSEPCEPGSCPSGYECRDFGHWAYRSEGQFFCVVREPVCGDGVREGYEACDDRNTTGGDGCSADCLSDETCGNGVIDAELDEQCDDGNVFSGDGCSEHCAMEECGNHIVDPGETCDDGNLDPADGCGSDCQLELCGNGVVDPSEACDDGNLVSTDGCDGLCRPTFNKGLLRLDSGWPRTQQAADAVQVSGHAAVRHGDRLVVAWSEVYDGAAPFGAAREVYTSTSLQDGDGMQAPARHPSLQGYGVESMARLDSGTIVLLLRDEMTFALARSTDGGATFGHPLSLTLAGVPTYTSTGAFARLHSDGEHLYLFVGVSVLVVAANRNLYMMRSSDGGLTWSTALRMSPQPDFRGWATPPRVLAFASGELVVAWGDGAIGGGSVIAARSLDHGVSWLRLNELMGPHATGRREETVLALENNQGYIHLAWAGPAGVRVARWARSSAPWQVTTVAEAASLDPRLGPISLVRGSGALMHLAFASGPAVFVARSTDVGGSFTAPHRVGRPPISVGVAGVTSLALGVDMSGGTEVTDRVRVAWIADVLTSGDAAAYRAYSVESVDGGATWSRDAAALGGSGASTALLGPGLERAAGSRDAALAAADRRLWLVDFLAMPQGAPEVVEAGAPGEGCAAALANGGWCTPSTLGAPGPRTRATAVWTGDEVLYFGGADDFRARNDGGAYDPLTDTWRSLDASGAELHLWGREGHTAVWTGSEMLIFGGHNGLAPLDDGAAYDPVTDTWRRLSSDGAPSARYEHTAVWTGTEMIVFGGIGATGALANGARYRPADDTWSAMPSAPRAVAEHTAVWTGDRMIVFGGRDSGDGFVQAGFAYDPTVTGTGAITPLPTGGAPTARAGHVAGWIADAMLVYGGSDNAGALAGGGRYTGAWQALPSLGAPSARFGHVGVVADDSWIVWGGTADRSGAVFDALAQQWLALDTTKAPGARRHPAAVWAGDRLIVLGGESLAGAPLRDGGIFVP